MEIKALRCPRCGGEIIYELNTVLIKYEVIGVTGANFHYSSSKLCSDTAERIEGDFLICDDCDLEFSWENGRYFIDDIEVFPNFKKVWVSWTEKIENKILLMPVDDNQISIQEQALRAIQHKTNMSNLEMNQRVSNLKIRMDGMEE